MKAKKIVSFFSLFSLVLVLSIYYVLSPVSLNNDEVVNGSVENESDEVVSIVDGETAYFENLEILKQNAFLDEIKELEAIVANASSTKEEKINALEVKNLKTKMNEKEKQLANIIKEEGYSNVYVEYEGEKVNILVGKKDATKKDALIVIRSINSSINEGDIPSVMFKS